MNSNDTESQDLCRKTGNDPKLRFSAEKLKSGNICLCIIVVCCVLLCSLLCASIFIYTHSTLKVMEERLSELSQELSKLRSECGSKSLSEQQVVTEESGSENQTLEIVYRNERSPKKLSPKKPVGAPAYIHLVGKEKGKLLNIEGEDTYFAWDKDENSPGLHGFELVPVGDNSYYKIKVKHPGVYLVYTQVGINGRDNINQPHECSHETVVQRMVKKKVEKTVLLKSLITQYELGGPYEINSHKQNMRALDTKVHMGVFMLMKDDILSVQVPKHCGNVEYTSTRASSYFGLAQLSPGKRPK